MTENQLFCGDNLSVLREQVPDACVDLSYVDPPFCSRRHYYHAQPNAHDDPRAFTDVWIWNTAARGAYHQIVENEGGRQSTQTMALLKGLRGAVGEGGLLAYLATLTLRIVEIRRVLREHGTFYLHCDPTAAHYLKLICDSIFCTRGGEFRNEIVWSYASGGRSQRDFPWKHDTILRYSKSREWTFNPEAVQVPRRLARGNHMKRGTDPEGRTFRSIRSAGKVYKYYDDEGVLPSDVWTDLSHLHQKDPERLGYPTQKPAALLSRIIAASSQPGERVLDAYCGSGTTLAAAARLGRRWLGIDLSPVAIELSRERLARLTEETTPVQPDDSIDTII